MRPILLAALSILLLVHISCSTVHSGNRMIVFKPDRQSIRYRGTEQPTRSITAIVKDDGNNLPLDQIVVELYTDYYRVEPLLTTMTSGRGKFSFTVKDGTYVIVVSNSNFKEAQVTVIVDKSDVDLNEIRLFSFYE